MSHENLIDKFSFFLFIRNINSSGESPFGNFFRRFFFQTKYFFISIFHDGKEASATSSFSWIMNYVHILIFN